MLTQSETQSTDGHDNRLPNALRRANCVLKVQNVLSRMKRSPCWISAGCKCRLRFLDYRSSHQPYATECPCGCSLPSKPEVKNLSELEARTTTRIHAVFPIRPKMSLYSLHILQVTPGVSLASGPGHSHLRLVESVDG